MKYKEQSYSKDQIYKIGDRVQVYGWVQPFNQPYEVHSGGLARVCYVFVDGSVNIHFEDSDRHFTVDREQIRLLLPVKPREFYLFRDHSMSYYEAKANGSKPLAPFGELIKVREILEE